MLEESVFSLMLACLATHELDAVDKHEWRLLYVLRRMEEDRARVVFIFLHIPLFAVIFLTCFSDTASLARYSRLFMNFFAVAHLLLHWRLRNHPQNLFAWPVSYAPIVGAAAFAGWHLWIELAA